MSPWDAVTGLFADHIFNYTFLQCLCLWDCFLLSMDSIQYLVLFQTIECKSSSNAMVEVNKTRQWIFTCHWYIYPLGRPFMLWKARWKGYLHVSGSKKAKCLVTTRKSSLRWVFKWNISLLWLNQKKYADLQGILQNSPNKESRDGRYKNCTGSEQRSV